MGLAILSLLLLLLLLLLQLAAGVGGLLHTVHGTRSRLL